MSSVRNFIPNQYTRFLSKVTADGFSQSSCWRWSGASKGNGYGNFSMNGQAIQAHRAAYILFVGHIPDGLDVCHTCDLRHCVNPDHLFLGTRAENMSDMRSKGRGAGGCRKHLREEQIQEIMLRLSSGHSPRKISTSMDVNYHTITAIRRGASYAVSQ